MTGSRARSTLSWAHPEMHHSPDMHWSSLGVYGSLGNLKQNPSRLFVAIDMLILKFMRKRKGYKTVYKNR